MSLEARLKQVIRDVPDFPKKGILFKDITPLLGDGKVFDQTIEALASSAGNGRIDLVAAVESRGFIFGSAVAQRLSAGFVPVRKPGKLPSATLRETYELEYGTDALEIHKDAVRAGQRVLLVDDLLATGGTARAASSLIRRLGGEVAGVSFVIELAFLNGRSRLEGLNVTRLVTF